MPRFLKRQINNLQKLVNSSTTCALVVNNANLAYVLPDLSPSEATDAAYVACSSISRGLHFTNLASQAGKTIELNTPLPFFEWIWGTCLGCGGSHCYTDKGLTDSIISPNRNHPGAAEHAARNVIKPRAERKLKKPRGIEGRQNI